MSSSMLAGERRWASARRGGMTVLGKVAVPKPINLPSQRLENHGLDPNVEIVPKGSLSWGSRSSSASNPWGTSGVSPNADGTVSPSHLSGRPSSSGGSGTRPSTAGSDKIHEVGGSAWGPNSRPSSASGPLTSNQALQASSRPRSAETRPGSSQLSRFAEPVADSSVAWGSTGTVEKLVLNSKSDNFSLSSGDFPTLGKNPEPEDNHSHGRPSSASGRVTSPKERAQTDAKGGPIDSWTRDGAQHVEDGVHPSAEKWHGDHPQYLNPNMPPQHFDAWRGPPMNPPASVWYRGPPGAPPYPPVAHGGFPIEPFPYYRPQIAPALANPQPVPPRGPGPRGHHPKNGDFYRPQMPDAFMRPGMPMRPGFYPGPVPYDGYYGPPMGYNPNEREIPFMGMPGGPPIYNMYPPQNSSEPGDVQPRAGGRGAGGKRLVTEHADLGHSDDTRGPYKVLKKRPNEWGLEEEENSEPTASATALHLEKGEKPRKASAKNEWGADNRTDEEFYSGRAMHGENHSSGTSLGHQDHSSDSAILKSPRDKSKAVDGSWGKKSEVASTFVEVPQVLPAASKDTALIQKIEILNAKVRAFDGREDVVPSSVREEQMNRVQLVNTKTNNHSINEAGGTPGDSISSPLELGGSTEETTSQATADTVPAISRRAHAGVHGRMDHQHKGRFNNHDGDGWRKKTPSLVSESSAAVAAVNHATVEAAEKSEIRPTGKKEEESSTPVFEPIDGQAQRAKMRELAKQRAIQLQKEEEERIREQKAKALAKLEELNRRTLAGDSSAQKLEIPVTSGAAQKDSEESKKHPGVAMDADKHVTEQLEKPLTSCTTQLDPEESQKHPGPVMDADKHAAQKLAKSVPSGATQWTPKESRKQPGPAMDVDKSELRSSVSTLNAQVVAQTRAGSNGGAGESSVLSKGLQFDAPSDTSPEPVVPHMQSVPSKLDVVNTGTGESKAVSNDVSLRRNKRNKQKQSVYVETVASDKQKQRIQVESVVTDKPTPNSTSQTQKGHDVGATEIVTSQVDPMYVPSIPNNTNIMQESVGHNRRKNNRNSRNKHKQDEAASSTASQSAGPPETHHPKTPASAAFQSAAPNEPHPSKNSAPASTSQAPVPKESLPPKPSATTASPSPGPKETHPAKTFAAAASQAPVQKETHQASAASQLPVQKETPPAKASNTAFLPVQKETLPAKASATAALKSPVQKETLPAKVSNHAASQPLVWKETRPARASATSTSQPLVTKETLPAKASATATSQPLVTKETLPAMASATAIAIAIATSQLPVQKETLPAKASPTTASQLLAQKETISAKASAAAAPQTPVQKETLPSKAPVTTASQRPGQKETLPSKASATATSQAQVKKETLPGKASGTAASQSLVHKESLPAKVAVTPLPKEIYAVKASAASQSSVPKETRSSQALPSVVSQSLVPNEAHRAIAPVSASSQLPVPKGTHPVKAPLERGQPKASQLELDTNSVQLVSDVKDANQQPSFEQSSPLPSEEANSRVNNQWKPQNSRRMPRNPQALRSGDKFHSSESVVWAPVRSQNKLEPESEGSEKVVHDATPATARNDTPVQSSVKSKRAELERYVPKPVAKELAQQGSIQQPVALASSTQTSDETSERDGSGSQSVKPEVGNGGSSLEPRNGDFKQSKPTRTPGSWRQRGSSEAQHDKGIQQTSFSTSNPSKNVQKSMNQQDTSKPDFSFVPVENKVCHDWDPSDGWSMPEEPSATATVTHVVKDEGVGTGRGRRQPQKGHRSTVNSHDIDHMNSSGGEADKNHTHFAATDISQAERAVSSREGRGSHWQPKSQTNLASNQRGSRYDGGQKDSFEVKKNSPPRGAQQDNKESSKITHQPTSEEYVSENKKVEEASNVRQEEARRERRSDSSRRHPRTPNQSVGPPDNMEEHAADQHYPSRRRPQTPNQSVGPPENMDEHAADQHNSSGFRRGGIQNNRGSGRGNESRRDWSSGGHENRPQHLAPNRERQRQNAHFEYQPVGSSNNNAKFNNFDGEGSRNMGQRYRERGSGRSRRGGAGDFHGQQQSGSIRVEAGND